MHSAAGLDKTWLRKDGRGVERKTKDMSSGRQEKRKNIRKIQVTKKNKVFARIRGFGMEDMV